MHVGSICSRRVVTTDAAGTLAEAAVESMPAPPPAPTLLRIPSTGTVGWRAA